MIEKEKKKLDQKKQNIKINYNEEIENCAGTSAIFDYFEDDDPFKEIIVS